MIYPEFRSRTPPPTYIASVMEYEDRRRVRSEAVEIFPDTSACVAVEPVPATPPPAYRGRATVHGIPVYCPRAVRTRPHSFVANDSSHPATDGSPSAVVARAERSYESDIIGKWTQDVGHDVMAAGSQKPDDPLVLDSHSNDVASCSSYNS